MVKKILAFLMFCLVMVGAKNVAASTSSIMVNAEDGSVMYEMNADEMRYPASLTKLMTLYITFNALENKHLKLTDQLKVSNVAASRSPSKLGVRAGTTITVKDAIMAVIVKSANDCATVLAEHFAKTEAEFAVLMTQTAKKLGMKRTTFKNASGLPNSQQKTTARDMATLAMAVYHHFPQYYSWFSAQSFKYKGQTIYGHNHLLKTFAGADGMKTGYTAASGYNIITSAKRYNKRVIAVTMGHKYFNERDKKVAVMMDKGLIELKKGNKVDVALLKQQINGGNNVRVAQNTQNKKQMAKAPIPARKQYAAATSRTKLQNAVAASVKSGNYAVQVGSFSDYKRAKNYALSVKNNLAKKFAVHNIKVEKINVAKGIMYRSKVVGLAKNDANKICQAMKRQKQACLVVADNSPVKLAQR
ncbi:MAG: D-alanyl-D-alanine carboxypeptidase [Alphaproteobacteria bacterium]|nr:D-alanyl-D-alanine carboxypeptidase [Alphaproteobacteria bacterium]